MWLDFGLMKINKRVIHLVTGYPTLNHAKSIKYDSRELIERETDATWNERGMSIDNIQDPLVEFAVRVIGHNFYQSSRLNSVPCMAVDLGYKIVIKDHSYDLAEFQL